MGSHDHHALVLLVVVMGVMGCVPYSNANGHIALEDDLPGWMGERHVSKSRKTNSIPTTILTHHQQPRFDPTRVVQLSWQPRAFLYEGFLSEEECDHLMELARSKLEKSMVADNESGKSIPSQVRTSSGTFLVDSQDEILKRIQERIATWTLLPEENGESIQVLRYQLGEKYEPHYDYFHDKFNLQMGGHRVATVLMYLSNVTKGGETVFPKTLDSRVKDDSWSDCAKKGLAVKAKKGTALLFFSLFPNATTDSSSLHGSCPVVEGEKWSATRWIHVDSFTKRKVSGCRDEDENCSLWATHGECTKNPIYMVGSDAAPGQCRKSCKVCQSSSDDE